MGIISAVDHYLLAGFEAGLPGSAPKGSINQRLKISSKENLNASVAGYGR